MSDSAAGLRLRRTLITAEVAMSAGLLIAAGLLLNSFVRLTNIDQGFRQDELLNVTLTAPGTKYRTQEQLAAFFQEVLNRVKALPQVNSVGVVSALPLGGNNQVNSFVAEGTTPALGATPLANYRFVNPEYFPTLDIPLHAGRFFDDRDRGRKVAVVSARTAERVWPGENVIGKRFRYMGPDSDPTEIVGIVGNVRIANVRDDEAERSMLMAYVPYWDRMRSTMELVIRTGARPETFAPMVRETIWQIDSEVPVPEFRTMKQFLAGTVARERFQMMLVVLFASAALMLAATGIYGVISYSVAQRRQEIAIRMALGARASHVRLLVLREGLAPVLTGLVLGLAGAFALSRFLNAFLYDVTSTDPWTFLGVAVLVFATGVAACYIPSRSATLPDPVSILRE